MNVNPRIIEENERKYMLTDVSSCTFTFSDGLKSKVIPSPDNEIVLVKLIPRISKIKRFEECVLKHYPSIKTVSELAEKCQYICVKTFTRHFKKCFGETPYQWILDRKMEEIQSLVLNTDMTITEISEMYEFKTLSHLISSYMKRYGITPHKDRLVRNG
ncbi:helix-turn-helix transcriptional regulator [Proteiniphilum sp.]|uniref:helix-turn-helix transcriptional regulator n=1 Tax=Proteiniphilum sp. TaxID=1926877 RepID=UPI002B1F5E4C|nr:helix-turn-helix transcriptional regulator [Proteiniphilum sp.]MEA4917482.1 helix-turn-helix transcriptional regulator [Proteiniphilum sp.]